MSNSRVFAIGDLHLSFSTPDKGMDKFGECWKNHPEKIKAHWLQNITVNDLVLIPGDISWAMKLQEALIDLQWIAELPGEKVMIRGNHDYWWGSLNKMKKVMPSTIHLIQNDAFVWNDYLIGGARLWDTAAYCLGPYQPKIAFEDEEIFLRELARLKLSLQAMQKLDHYHAKKWLIMVHYPPFGNDQQATVITKLLEEYKVSLCVFGHLHGLPKDFSLQYNIHGIDYYQTSADSIDFNPIRIR